MRAEERATWFIFVGYVLIGVTSWAVGMSLWSRDKQIKKGSGKVVQRNIFFSFFSNKVVDYRNNFSQGAFNSRCLEVFKKRLDHFMDQREY